MNKNSLIALMFSFQILATQTVRADVQQEYVRLSQDEYQQLLSRAQQNGEFLPRQSGVTDTGPDGEPMVRLTNREYTKLIEQSKPEAHESWSDKLPPLSMFSFWLGWVLGWVSGMVGIIIFRLLIRSA